LPIRIVNNMFFTDLLIDYNLLGAKNDQYWLIMFQGTVWNDGFRLHCMLSGGVAVYQ